MAPLGSVFFICAAFLSLTFGQRLILMHGDRQLMDGEQLAMEDIGNDRNTSLRCITTQVNSNCCRSRDGGSIGDWYLPTGELVPRGRDIGSLDPLARKGYAQEVQLLRLMPSSFMTVFGNFICRVPDPSGVVFSITIFLHPTPCRPSYCDDNANCSRLGNILSKRFTCACRTPFDGDGFSCTVPDMCQSSPCPVNSTCHRNGTYNETYYCSCPPSYYWTGQNCSLIPTTPPPTTTAPPPTTTLPPTPPTTVGVVTSDVVIGGGTVVLPDGGTDEVSNTIGNNPATVSVRVLPLISEEESPEIVPRVTAHKPPGPRSLYMSFTIVPDQGDIDKVQILVQRQPSRNTLISTYYLHRSATEEFPQYVAMEINMKDPEQSRNIEVVIGTIKSCARTESPCNGPLEPNTPYAIRYILTSGTAVAHYDFGVVEMTAPTPEDTTSIIVGVVLVVALFLFLVILLVVVFLAVLHRDRIIATVAKRTRTVSTFPDPAVTQATPPEEDETKEKDVELDDEEYDDKVSDLEATAV